MYDFMIGEQLADVSTRCSSHPWGESEAIGVNFKHALIYSCTLKDTCMLLHWLHVYTCGSMPYMLVTL